MPDEKRNEQTTIFYSGDLDREGCVPESCFPDGAFVMLSFWTTCRRKMNAFKHTWRITKLIENARQSKD